MRRPAADLIERVAAEEASRYGVQIVAVLGASHNHAAIAARKRAWVRLVLEERFPILGVATAWGCDRRGIQRALTQVAVGGGE